MTTTMPSTELVVPVEPLFSQDEQTALAGFLAGYSGLTRDAYALDLRIFTAWCEQCGRTCSRPDGPTSSASAATWSPEAVHARPSLADCARSRASTATRSRRNCSSTHLPSTCDDPVWTTSHTLLVWTVTRSPRCLSPPGSAHPTHMR
jgi:hypothetical protein